MINYLKNVNFKIIMEDFNVMFLFIAGQRKLRVSSDRRSKKYNKSMKYSYKTL